MPVLCKVGSITAPPATNHGLSYTGIGFPPKAILVFGNAQFADGANGTSGTNANMPCTLLGIGVSSSAYGADYSDDNFATGDTKFTGAFMFQTFGSLNTWTALLVSLDADGFTLDWTVLGANAGANVPPMHYMALGGSSLQASLVKTTIPVATGNHGFTGAGFPPECVLSIGGGFATNATMGFGITDGVNQAASASNYGGAATTRYQRTNKCYVSVRGNTLWQEANIVSLDSDGATFNWTTIQTQADNIYHLCLASGQGFKVGTFNLNTVTGNQSVSGLGLTPVGVLLSSIGRTSITTPDTSRIVLNMSATDGVGRGSVLLGDGNDGVAAMSRARMIDLYGDNTTPTVISQADIVSLNSGGFTFNISATDGATAAEMIYLAVSGAAGGAGPPLLGQPPATHSIFGPF